MRRHGSFALGALLLALPAGAGTPGGSAGVRPSVVTLIARSPIRERKGSG